MNKIYRVAVDMIETGYVEVEAKSKKEAIEKAGEAVDGGEFVGYNSNASIGKVLEIRLV